MIMKNAITALIADGDRDFRLLLSDCLAAEGITVAGLAADGTRAVELFSSLRPDVLLLDLVLPKLDGLSVLERLKDEVCGTAVFVVSAFYNDALVARCAKMGVRFFVPKPCCLPELAAKIRLSAARLRELPRCPVPWQLDEDITRALRVLGVPAHIGGYRYLREAIRLSVCDADILGAVTKELYPEVAKRFSTTPQRVERSMRRAIESAWSRLELSAAAQYFGSAAQVRHRPTNSEFIAAIADRLLLDQRAGRSLSYF